MLPETFNECFKTKTRTLSALLTRTCTCNGNNGLWVERRWQQTLGVITLRWWRKASIKRQKTSKQKITVKTHKGTIRTKTLRFTEFGKRSASEPVNTGKMKSGRGRIISGGMR